MSQWVIHLCVCKMRYQKLKLNKILTKRKKGIILKKQLYSKKNHLGKPLRWKWLNCPIYLKSLKDILKTRIRTKNSHNQDTSIKEKKNYNNLRNFICFGCVNKAHMDSLSKHKKRMRDLRKKIIIKKLILKAMKELTCVSHDWSWNF